MSTPHDNATEFLTALETLGFQPARWDDSKGNRQLERKSPAGHPLLRLCLDYQGEGNPHNISVIKFNGQKGQMVEWSSENMSAHMPTSAMMAMLQAL